MLNAEDENVVVIGEGTRLWTVCAQRSARMQNLSRVFTADKVNMPGSQREVQNAEEEGVNFQWLSAPNA